MTRIPKWLIAVAVVFSIGLVTPSMVEAQDCYSCNSLTGFCEPDPWYGADSCYQGFDRENREFFCASWGGLVCDPRVTMDDIGADGTFQAVGLYATAASTLHDIEDRDPVPTYTRDCRSHIVARSYATDEAMDMRRRTESIRI